MPAVTIGSESDDTPSLLSSDAPAPSRKSPPLEGAGALPTTDQSTIIGPPHVLTFLDKNEVDEIARLTRQAIADWDAHDDE